MSGLNWLHLSDWHQKGPHFDFGRDVVRKALIRDIRERAERINPSLEQVDFVVFSGDLSFNGKPDEYKAAQAHLLDPMLDAVGLKPKADQKADHLFIVPGNHDLDRDIVFDKDCAPVGLQKPLASPEEVETWLKDDRKFGRVIEPFEAYRKFVAGYTGQKSPDYASFLPMTTADGKDIALLGLNSAWMCARNKDAKDKINDYGYTLVGEPQIRDKLEEVTNKFALRIAVLHHPIEWLAEFDRLRIKFLLRNKFDFILSGHEHCPQVEMLHSTLGKCIIIPAGASYERRIANDPRYTNAYNFVHLDFDDGRGVVYLRKWSDPTDEWVADHESYTNGEYPFSFR